MKFPRVPRNSGTAFGCFRLAGLLLAGGILCQLSLNAAQEIKFQTVPLSHFIADDVYWGEGRAAPPLDVEIPAVYVKTQVMVVACMWSTESDVKKILEPDTPPQENGFFKVQISRGTGFDMTRNLFFSNNGQDEKKMAGELSAQGIQKVSVERYDIKGAPILIVEGVLPGGHTAKMAYLAMRMGTNVIQINYVPRHVWSDWDTEVWTRFRRSLVAKKAAT